MSKRISIGKVLSISIAIIAVTASVNATVASGAVANNDSAQKEKILNSVLGKLKDLDQKISDFLKEKLSELKAGEKIPVIVTFSEKRGLSELPIKINPKWVYNLVPGFAAELTREQIRSLSAVSFVKRIEEDLPVRVMLDSATKFSGVTKARSDFGLDGDGDGSPTVYTKDDIVIAIIDTGIDTRHVDLDGGKVIGWKDFVDNRPSSYDDHGHGTHVASIAAGTGEGNSAYRGVAPGAALVGVKVLDAQGSGSLSTVQAGIEWCVNNKATYGIEVISMSLGAFGLGGFYDGSDSLSLTVDAAVDSGIVVVVAAGNEGALDRYGTIAIPGVAKKAITVGAVADPGDKGWYLAKFSSRGPTADGRMKPDLVAPGVGVYAAKAGTTKGYVSYSGTSMSTPLVAGVVALMLDANPRLTPAQIKGILRDTAWDWGPSYPAGTVLTMPWGAKVKIVDGSGGSDTEYGWGILKAYSAIKQAGGFSGTEPAQPVHTNVSLTLNVGSKSDIVYTLPTREYPVTITVVIPEVCRSDKDTPYGTKPDKFILEVWDMGWFGTGFWPRRMASDSGRGDRTLVAKFNIPWYWPRPYRVHLVVKYEDGTYPKEVFYDVSNGYKA